MLNTRILRMDARPRKAEENAEMDGDANQNKKIQEQKWKREEYSLGAGHGRRAAKHEHAAWRRDPDVYA